MKKKSYYQPHPKLNSEPYTYFYGNGEVTLLRYILTNLLNFKVEMYDNF